MMDQYWADVMDRILHPLTLKEESFGYGNELGLSVHLQDPAGPPVDLLYLRTYKIPRYKVTKPAVYLTDDEGNVLYRQVAYDGPYHCAECGADHPAAARYERIVLEREETERVPEGALRTQALKALADSVADEYARCLKVVELLKDHPWSQRRLHLVTPDPGEV